MSEHTPKLHTTNDAGIWNVSTDECGASSYQALTDESGTVVALVVSHDASHWSNNPDPRPNARRLVAAWNACELMPTEDIERLSAIGEGVMRLVVQADEYRAERDSLRAVNAELIKALERSADALDRLTDKVDGTGFSSSDEFNNALDEIDLGRAAIASARKQGEPPWLMNRSSESGQWLQRQGLGGHQWMVL